MSDAGLELADPLAQVVAGPVGGVKRTPNVVHTAVATSVVGGAVCWTTNWDEFIESEIERLTDTPAEVATTPQHVQSRSTLRKPHGTASQPSSMMFSTSDVIRPADDSWIELAEADMKDATVIVAGYGGADVDLYPVLRRGFNAAQEVLWLEGSKELRRYQKWRFDLEDRELFAVATPGKWSVSCGSDDAETNPSDALLGLLHETARTSPPDWDLVQTNTVSQLEAISARKGGGRGDRLLMRAKALERLGERRRAFAHHFALLLVGPERRHRLKAISAVWNLAAYRPWPGRNWILPIAAKAATPLVRKQTDVQQGQVDVPSEAELLAEIAAGRTVTSIDETLALCANERWIGDLETTATVAAMTIDRALGQDLASTKRDWPERVSRACYETAQTQLWQGKWGEVDDACKSGLMRVSGAKWVGWESSLLAGLAFLDHRDDDALTLMREATAILEAEGFYELTIHTLCAQSRILHNLGDTRCAEKSLEVAAQRLHGGLGGQISLALERAETLTAKGELMAADTEFSKVIDIGRTLFSSIARLRRYEIGTAPDDELRAAAQGFEATNCEWGQQRAAKALRGVPTADDRYFM